MNKIPISKPYLGPEEMEAVQKPLETGWVVQGPYVKKFEDAFSEYTKSQFSAASTSCTTALHLSVAALDLKPGQEVIVPAFTWVSTANVVEYMGAKPVFCDVDLQTFNIDPKKAAELVNEKTVGMIPVHLFGLCVDMEPLLKLCREHKLWMVEDAACAAGAWYNGKHAGTFGEFGCFSFHPRKAITTGEGGMIICKDKKDYEILKSLRSHGWSREKKTAIKYPNLDPRYIFINSGFNLRPTDIQAAIGLSQFKKLKKFMKIRINNRNKIIKTLKMHKNWSDQFSFVEVPKKISPSYMVFPIFLNKKFRKKKTDFINFVESKGLETRPIISGSFVKQPSTKLFKLNQKNKKFPGANLVHELGFVIGLHTKNISSSKLKFLSETLLSIDRL